MFTTRKASSHIGCCCGGTRGDVVLWAGEDDIGPGLSSRSRSNMWEE